MGRSFPRLACSGNAAALSRFFAGLLATTAVHFLLYCASLVRGGTSMNIETLRLFINRPEGMPGVLSTSDGQGGVNGAIFGSARLTDEGLLLLGLGENRSLRNLRRHNRAVLTLFEPGNNPLAWQGARLYLEVSGIEHEGVEFAQLTARIRQAAGVRAARRIRAAVFFRITEIRPLIDLSP